MVIDIHWRTILFVLASVLVEALFFVFILPRIGNSTGEPPCHDAIYVQPLVPTEDEDPRIDFGGKKMVFICPHSQQKLDLVGRGGFTCKCDEYRGKR